MRDTVIFEVWYRWTKIEVVMHYTSSSGDPAEHFIRGQ